MAGMAGMAGMARILGNLQYILGPLESRTHLCRSMWSHLPGFGPTGTSLGQGVACSLSRSCMMRAYGRFQALPSEDQSHPFRRGVGVFPILDLGFQVLDRGVRINVDGEGSASQGFHKDLHSTTPCRTDCKVERILVLDVIVRQSVAIIEDDIAILDQRQMLRRNTLPVLENGLDVGDGGGGLDVEVEAGRAPSKVWGLELAKREHEETHGNWTKRQFDVESVGSQHTGRVPSTFSATTL